MEREPGIGEGREGQGQGPGAQPGLPALCCSSLEGRAPLAGREVTLSFISLGCQF